MLTKYFPLVVYLGVGGFIFALIGATVYMLAHGNGSTKSDNPRSKNIYMAAIALGVLGSAYAGYKITHEFGFASIAIVGAVVYALFFLAGLQLAAKKGVRKTMTGSFYGLFAIAVAGILNLMFFGGHAGAENRRAKIDVTDKVSLQHGAAVFRDYCLSCHGLSMVRYNQLTKLGMSEDDIRQNMLTTADKIGETMHVSMRPADAKQWFGVVPPDLSLEAAAKKPDWIYSYLTGFYKDDNRPTGWNNLYFENVGMPHALWQEQGIQELSEEGKKKEAAHRTHEDLVLTTKGKQDPETFDKTANDVVNFLVWASEPDQTKRKMIGYGVLAFLFVLFAFAWRLSKNYWKDIR